MSGKMGTDERGNGGGAGEVVGVFEEEFRYLRLEKCAGCIGFVSTRGLEWILTSVFPELRRLEQEGCRENEASLGSIGTIRAVWDNA